MTQADLVEGSLEALAAGADPVDAVYRRLFELRPETEALFALGRTAWGHMLQEAVLALLDVLRADSYGLMLLRSERSNHEGLGVSGDIFLDFYIALRDVVRAQIGAAFTAEVDAAWSGVLCDIRARLGP